MSITEQIAQIKSQPNETLGFVEDDQHNKLTGPSEKKEGLELLAEQFDIRARQGINLIAAENGLTQKEKILLNPGVRRQNSNNKTPAHPSFIIK